MRRLAALLLALAVVAAGACGPSIPPGSAQHEAGKKHCGSNDDCASGLCRDNRCQ